MEGTEMLKTFVFLAAIFSGAVARADLIYLTQLRSVTGTATIARAVPDVKTKTISAPDFEPFNQGSSSFVDNFAFSLSSATVERFYQGDSVLGPNSLNSSVPISAFATGDSTNQYGVAEGAARTVIQ